MPKFYFNLRDDRVVDNEEGREFADLAAARNHAEDTARALAAANVLGGHMDLDHKVEILDFSRQVVAIVQFRDVVTVTG